MVAWRDHAGIVQDAGYTEHMCLIGWVVDLLEGAFDQEGCVLQSCDLLPL
jgi:hypothetical protein